MGPTARIPTSPALEIPPRRHRPGWRGRVEAQEGGRGPGGAATGQAGGRTANANRTIGTMLSASSWGGSDVPREGDRSLSRRWLPPPPLLPAALAGIAVVVVGADRGGRRRGRRRRLGGGRPQQHPTHQKRRQGLGKRHGFLRKDGRIRALARTRRLWRQLSWRRCPRAGSGKRAGS
jgi:hypothetical protein